VKPICVLQPMPKNNIILVFSCKLSILAQIPLSPQTVSDVYNTKFMWGLLCITPYKTENNGTKLTVLSQNATVAEKQRSALFFASTCKTHWELLKDNLHWDVLYEVGVCKV
jgi:hypothetical protein